VRTGGRSGGLQIKTSTIDIGIGGQCPVQDLWWQSWCYPSVPA
jgi:hypothetical protein